MIEKERSQRTYKFSPEPELRFREDEGFPYFASIFSLRDLARAAISSADLGCGTLLCRFIENGSEGEGLGAARTLADSETSSARRDSDEEETIVG